MKVERGKHNYFFLRNVYWGQAGQLTPAISDTILEVKIGRIVILGQPRQKVIKTSSQSVHGMWYCAPVISATWEATGKRIVI
jgi:hypothetical protein